ncbi:hypothetical protein RCH09_003168 [Actimicrobium sp. GrIS 1.19]|uniref:chemotaxis protein n=1 Tax=Actimicrobium sp. GrIS 1.19 TaxID=3071708 RepID=UPI002DFAB6DC|nr:hypothetical protein [Actimicrobium sp. GrIS 1.19]
MTQNNQVGLFLKRLLGGVAGQGGDHLSEVETDLAQTALLLAEAIEKLGASFMAIHAAVGAQQEAVDLIMAGGAPTPEHAVQLKAIQHDIGRHVNAAVTGLQFQDMTSQLINRTLSRINGMREVLDVLGSTATKIQPENTIDDLTELLAAINDAMEERSARLGGALRKAVSQTHMESGDIELF